MTVATVADITTNRVRTMAASADDPLGDDVVEGPEAGAKLLIQHLLFIFSSFQLTAALASSIPILTDRHNHTEQAADRPKQSDADSLFFISNPRDFLDIHQGCVPVSIDVAAYQITWPNWAVLLPEIPNKNHFKILGASA